MRKNIHLVLYSLFSVFYLLQLIQFLLLDGINGPYPFLLSMIVFNVVFIVISKDKPNDIALGSQVGYFIWYTIVFFTIKPEGPFITLGIDMYYFFIKVGFTPAELVTFTEYFESVLAASVYLLPFVFIVNVDFFKTLFSKKNA
jgi:hypothetical protein